MFLGAFCHQVDVSPSPHELAFTPVATSSIMYRFLLEVLACEECFCLCHCVFVTLACVDCDARFFSYIASVWVLIKENFSQMGLKPFLFSPSLKHWQRLIEILT